MRLQLTPAVDEEIRTVKARPHSTRQRLKKQLAPYFKSGEEVAGARAKGIKTMNSKTKQVLTKRNSSQNLPAAGKRQPAPPVREHPQERESRLKREESDARWKRIKEIIVIGLVGYISVCASTLLMIVLLTGTYPSTDKLILITLITQLLSNLFLNLAGKMPELKK